MAAAVTARRARLPPPAAGIHRCIQQLRLGGPEAFVQAGLVEHAAHLAPAVLPGPRVVVVDDGGLAKLGFRRQAGRSSAMSAAATCRRSLRPRAPATPAVLVPEAERLQHAQLVVDLDLVQHLEHEPCRSNFAEPGRVRGRARPGRSRNAARQCAPPQARRASLGGYHRCRGLLAKESTPAADRAESTACAAGTAPVRRLRSIMALAVATRFSYPAGSTSLTQAPPRLLRSIRSSPA